MNVLEADWPFTEKLRVVNESKELFGAALMTFLRQEGLTAELLKQWRQETRAKLYGNKSHLFRS